ncbi:WSC-domain-containing protein, partial [Calocera cornea HHB12733]
LTVASCTARCSAAGYTYAGLEYAQECHCDNSLQNGLGTALAAGSCNMACDGDATELCGGNYAMNLWQLKAGSGTSTSTRTSTSTSSSAAPTSSAWVSLGCVTDGQARALPAYFAQLSDNSVELCTAKCAAAGYTYAGVEYGQECHCDNSLQNGLGVATSASSCNMACDGNAKEICG